MMANISQTATLIVMAGLTAASELGKSGQMGGVAMIFLFFVIYCSTWGPLSWVYASEIFPTQIRSVSAPFQDRYTRTNGLAEGVFNGQCGQLVGDSFV